MKITFLSPPPNFSGGERVIAIYASRLTQLGHEVEIVCSKRNYVPFWRNAINFLRGHGLPTTRRCNGAFYSHYGVRYRVVDHYGAITKDDVNDGDAVIATWWETAHWASKLPSNKGVGVYFMQDYEMPYLPLSSLEPTWNIGLKVLTISSYCNSIVQERYPQNTVIVHNAIDKTYWQPLQRTKPTVNRFGFVFSEAPQKGADICSDSINMAAKNTSATFVAFGRSQVRPSLLENTPWIEYIPSPTDEAAAQIYQSCTGWLFGTRVEGFGLPILESMASRTPVIATPAGAAPELLHRGGGLLIAAENPTAMAQAISRMSEMSSMEWARMSEAAYHTATTYTWDDATNLFEAALKAAVCGEWDQYAASLQNSPLQRAAIHR